MWRDILSVYKSLSIEIDNPFPGSQNVGVIFTCRGRLSKMLCEEEKVLMISAGSSFPFPTKNTTLYQLFPSYDKSAVDDFEHNLFCQKNKNSL